jgi:hypothetical protein
MTGTAELVTAVRSAKQFLTYMASEPFRYAVAEALRLPDSYFEEFRADMRGKEGTARGRAGAGGLQGVPAGRHTSSPPTSAPSARPTASPSAAPSPSARAWSLSRTPSSTTTARPAPPSSASLSASGRRCWRRRPRGSRDWPPDATGERTGCPAQAKPETGGSGHHLPRGDPRALRRGWDYGRARLWRPTVVVGSPAGLSATRVGVTPRPCRPRRRPRGRPCR